MCDDRGPSCLARRGWIRHTIFADTAGPGVSASALRTDSFGTCEAVPVARRGKERAVTVRDERGRDDRLYLEELRVGQRFTSGAHRLDTAQIKAFARQFDPQPFHLDEGLAKGTCSRV